MMQASPAARRRLRRLLLHGVARLPLPRASQPEHSPDDADNSANCLDQPQIGLGSRNHLEGPNAQQGPDTCDKVIGSLSLQQETCEPR